MPTSINLDNMTNEELSKKLTADLRTAAEIKLHTRQESGWIKGMGLSGSQVEYIENHIKSLLSQHDSELREKVEKLTIDIPSREKMYLMQGHSAQRWYDKGTNDTVEHVLSLIK